MTVGTMITWVARWPTSRPSMLCGVTSVNWTIRPPAASEMSDQPPAAMW